MRILAPIALAAILGSCTDPWARKTPIWPGPHGPWQALSLLGHQLARPKLDASKSERLESDLAAAKAKYAADPSEDNLIWYGRRTAYLGLFFESIEIYTRGLEDHPDSAAILRHRGHRYITTRRLDKAIADLSRAWGLVRGKPDETEPDGAPNDKNIPVSSLQSNISYHLALAYYLKGDYERALAVHRDRMEVSRVNDDRLVSTSYWMYLTLRKLGRDTEAAAVLGGIGSDLNIVENQTYHRLLLLFKGELRPAEVLDTSGDGPIENGTAAYGIGCWHWFRGERDVAVRIWERVVASANWPAFGYIAAEAELARMRR